MSYKRPFYYSIGIIAFPILLLLWFIGWIPFVGRNGFSPIWFYLAISLFTFFIYALDKLFAANNRWRISEIALHILSLCGGWPGAWLAQLVLQHKTRKWSFQCVFWITAVINSGLFYLSLEQHPLLT